MKVDSSAWRDPNDSDQVAQVYVIDNGKVLILKRSDWLAWAPNRWALPGGHVEIGEENEIAAIRELQEETQLAAVIIEHFESDDHLHYFIVTQYTIEIKLNEEHTDYAWVSVEELNDFDIVPEVKKRIETLFNTVR